MFTTGVHGWLYAGAGSYALAWALHAGRRRAAGRFLLLLGLLFHGLYLIGRGWLGDVFFANPIVEGPFFLPWCLAAIALVQAARRPEAGTGAIMALTVLFSATSLFYAKGMVPPTPVKGSVWALLFFLSESLSHALFYTGALYAALSLAGRQGAYDFFPWIVWGFIVYTIAQVTGAVWCFLGWGNTFSWSPRHLGSAAIWTFFAATLHLPHIAGWKRRGALFALAGGVLVLWISYGNYLHEMRFARVGG